MSEIKIDTGKVREVANTISNNNTKLDSEFKAVENAISYIENGWVGAAKDGAIDKFNQIKKLYFENATTSRHASIQNHVKFLKEYIGDVYDEVETTNTSLADAFK